MLNGERISLLAYYGYGYEGHSDQKWYAITQVMIWRTTNPESDIYFTDTLMVIEFLDLMVKWLN